MNKHNWFNGNSVFDLIEYERKRGQDPGNQPQNDCYFKRIGSLTFSPVYTEGSKPKDTYMMNLVQKRDK